MLELNKYRFITLKGKFATNYDESTTNNLAKTNSKSYGRNGNNILSLLDYYYKLYYMVLFFSYAKEKASYKNGYFYYNCFCKLLVINTCFDIT